MWTVTHTPQTNAPYRHVSIITVWQSSQIGKNKTGFRQIHSLLSPTWWIVKIIVYRCYIILTLCPKKKDTPWCLTIILANVDQFSKFFHHVILEKISYVYTLRVPSHLQYVSTLPCEIRKSKKVNEFSRWTWHLICVTKICCEILRNLPHKYCTYVFTWVCVQHMEYSVERTKTVQR